MWMFVTTGTIAIFSHTRMLTEENAGGTLLLIRNNVLPVPSRALAHIGFCTDMMCTGPRPKSTMTKPAANNPGNTTALSSEEEGDSPDCRLYYLTLTTLIARLPLSCWKNTGFRCARDITEAEFLSRLMIGESQGPA
jgi:hypothetical protein